MSQDIKNTGSRTLTAVTSYSLRHNLRNKVPPLCGIPETGKAVLTLDMPGQAQTDFPLHCPSNEIHICIGGNSLA